MIGTRLSHYRIVDTLGAGGMGVVYRARDERLERDVAIKVLPAGALADEITRKQFRTEALTLSRLSHPNIGMVFDFDRDHGIDFLVLELIGGRTLSERIAEGALSEEEIARLGGQLADGLAAAHNERILHRDVKPKNLRLTPEGRLKILDFGLAKLIRREGDLTTTQTASMSMHAVGTLPYMAPEQLRGGPVDARSDIYAAGGVLYEMATGRRAFPQETTPAIVGAILAQPPTAPREITPRISKDLEGIILRCLEKEPVDRYRSAEELAADLHQIAIPETRRRFARPTPKRRSIQLMAVGIGAFVLLACTVVGLNTMGLRDQLFGSAGTAIQSLAVLPLANLSGDPGQEYFADGMTDELITRLAQVGALRVISRSSVMQYKVAKKPLPEIAKELRVKMIVEGSVLRAGDRVRISAELIDAARERPVWAERYERPAVDVLTLQGDVAQAIVQEIRARVTSNEQKRLAVAGRVNPEAHALCLKGTYFMGQWKTTEAFESFKRALDLDPGYAPAWAGLATYYIQVSSAGLMPAEAMPRAREAVMKALALDPQLATAHASLASIEALYDWEWKKAEAHYRHAIELNPSDPVPRQDYGQLLVIQKRHAEAERQMQKAIETDPLSTVSRFRALWPLYEGRNYVAAIEKAKELRRAQPDFYLTPLILGQAYAAQGDYARSLEMMKFFESPSTNPMLLAWAGYAHARAGDKRRAVEIVKELTARSDHEFVQPYAFAVIYTGLGDKGQALGWLERAADLRTDEVLFIATDPSMDPLRGEPRFRALLRRMGLPT